MSDTTARLHPEWQTPPPDMFLNDHSVHIWAALLDQPEAVMKRLGEPLSPDERERAAKFYFERHRQDYIVARGVLRSILGHYLGIEPRDVRFVYGEKGKPALYERPPAVRFNLSHSGRMALYAMTRGREVGIDLEFRRALDDLEALAERNFSRAEITALRGLPAGQRAEGFFNCWTRKEAYIKALGDGLSFPLEDFDVTLRPGEPARLLRVANAPEETERWKLLAVDAGEQYSAAVAVEGHDRLPQVWRWEETVTAGL